jgi:hypothetical protein
MQLDANGMEVTEHWNQGYVDQIGRKPAKVFCILDQPAEQEDPKINRGSR